VEEVVDPSYETEWISKNVVVVRCPFEKVTDEFWFLLTSDVHLDNQYCDDKFFKKHLDQMVERGGGWIDNGDLMCLMQGKWDPRSDQSQLRLEHKGNDYLDRVKKTTSEFLTPYADHVIALGHGNHETNVINRHGVDMTERVCAELAARADSPARCHAIQGWVQFRCYKSTESKTFTMFRHHGYGGASPVSKGVLHTGRLAAQYPDANIVVTGHDHNDWIFPIPRARLTAKGTEYRDQQLHVKIPGYKRAPTSDSNWERVKGFPLTNIGAVWLRVYMSEGHFRYECIRDSR
jgi:hypothetical protein